MFWRGIKNVLQSEASAISSECLESIDDLYNGSLQDAIVEGIKLVSGS